MSWNRVTRRYFLGMAGGLAMSRFTARSRADDRPTVTDPRATSGDSIHEPDWQQLLEISVGSDKADLIGSTEKPIQAAVDYMARMGGGTVRLLPGTYRLRNAVYLSSKVRLVGSGSETVLIKEPSTTVELSQDSDWYDQEVTLADAKGFEVGDGIVLKTTNPHNGGTDVIKRTLVGRTGNRFKLDRALRKNFWIKGKPTASTLFPLLSGENTADVVIENLTLDGNRKENTNLNGNYGGCIFLQDSNRYTIRNVTARNYNGDGISWQICHDVVVENCHSHSNDGLGLHPGSGSQRPLMRGNKVERNRLGIFFCWGVKYGLAENNLVDANESYGISIGHCDTDNLIRNNQIQNSGQAGILFRDDARGLDFWPHRNRVENNKIVDSGSEEGIGIDITGKARQVTISNNKLIETRKPMKRTGVRIGTETKEIKLDANQFDGFATDVVDQRKSI